VSTAKRLHYTYDEYLDLVARSDFKLEYCDGVIYAMAGGTVVHAALGAAIIGLLRNNLPAPCRVFSSDLKIRIDASDLSTFPDASVVCGEPRPARIDPQALTNPILIVEVTSRSTEDYDRGDKLSHYKQIPALCAVMFVSHRTQAVTVVSRDGTGWNEREFRAGEVVTLDEPAARIAVDDIYAGLTLE
jgi:Uma2 family endonuclease